MCIRDRAQIEHLLTREQQRLVTIVGPGGMGKTRLVTDFVATRGAVVTVSAHPGDALAPYSLLARLVRALVGRVDGAIAPGLRGELARLLPELGEAQPLRDGADRRRMLRAIEGRMYIATANAAPAEGQVNAPSGIMSPEGKWLVQCPRAGEHRYTFDVEVDIEKI